MGLTLITGRAGMGKTTKCFDLIKESIGENISDKNIILIVPEQFTLEMESAFLNKTELSGMINVKVLSFKRLAYNVFSEVGGITKIPLNDIGKSMILRKVINKVKDDLKSYKKACNKAGFTKKLSEMFSDFKKYSVSSIYLEDVSEQVKGDMLLSDKLEDLKLLYSEFNGFFLNNYINRDEELSMAVPKIMDSMFLEEADIYIDGFDYFLPQQYEVVEALLKKCSNVTIALTVDSKATDVMENESGDPFFITRSTMKNLSRICEKNHIELNQHFPLYYENTKNMNRYSQSQPILELEKNYFSYPCTKYNKYQEDIVIFTSANRYTEVKRTAREIVRLVRENGYKWKDCAVIIGNTEIYENIISAIFTEFEIPFFIDKKVEIKQHPLIKLIQAALEILTTNYSYNGIFKYLRTELTGIDRADTDIIENYVLAYGIRGSRWTQKEDWNYYSNLGSRIQGKGLQIEARINEIRNEITEPLKHFNNQLKKSSCIKDMCAAVFELVSKLDVYNKIMAWAVDDELNGRQEQYRKNSGIWTALIQVLDQMAEILGDEKVSIEEFKSILEAGFEDAQMGIIPPSIDQVFIGNLERSRSHEIQALFMLGVNDGILPKQIEDNDFISDEEKGKIKAAGFDFLMDSQTKAFMQQFLIYSAITKPSKYLHLSYALADEEGKALRPSFIINRVKEIFPSIKEKSDVLYHGEVAEDIEHISSMKATFPYLVSQLRLYSEGKDINPLWWDVYRETKIKNPEKINRVIDAIFYSNLKDNFIDKNLIKKIYGPNVLSSVTRIEKYENCPFSFFIEYGLKAAQRREFSISVPDIGQLFHNIIEEFFVFVQKGSINYSEIDEEIISSKIDELIENYSKAYNNKIFHSSNKNTYLLKRLRRILIKTISKMVEHIKMGEFIPVDFEVEFGGKASNKTPIIIEINQKEKIELRGKIDRVDILEESDKKYIKIIDYKSGNTEFDLTDIYYGLDIQLIVYLDAVLKYYEKLSSSSTIIEPAGMFYFHIKDPYINAKTLTELNSKLSKEYKMSGLALENQSIIKKLDMSLTEGGTSDIIPAGLKKDGSFYSNSSVASPENFEMLRNYVKNLITGLCKNILNGEVPIRPYKKATKTGCDYCDFLGVCQFDKHFDGNTYNQLKSIGKNEFWELLKNKSQAVSETVEGAQIGLNSDNGNGNGNGNGGGSID